MNLSSNNQLIPKSDCPLSCPTFTVSQADRVGGPTLPENLDPFKGLTQRLDSSCMMTYNASLIMTYNGGLMKTQMMQFRVNDEEKALIEKCAKKAGMTVSEYIRACMLMEMVIDGELQALRIIGRTIGMKAMDALSRRLKVTPALD